MYSPANWLYNPDFPEYWERHSLYGLARWVNGLAFRDIHFSTQRKGKPVIKIAEVKNGITGQTKYTEQAFDTSVHVGPCDLIFSWSGQPETSIDVFRWRGPDGWLNQHLFRVTPDPRINEPFFYYLLRYLRPHFVGIARNKQTTGLGHVTKRDLEALVVGIPPLGEQRAIAEVLGALDDKIEANKRQVELLWSIVRSLYVYATLDADLVPLGELVELAYGKGLPASKRAGGAIPVFGSGGIAGWHDQPLVTGPGVVVGRKGTIGSVYWVDSDFFPIDTTFYAVPEVGVPTIVAYLTLDGIDFSDMNSDSAVPGLNRNAALSKAVPLLSKAAMSQLADATEPLVSLAKCLAEESGTLQEIRDALLPNLMSGELHVRDAEHVVEEAV